MLSVFILSPYLARSCGQLYKKIDVVGLYLGRICRLVADCCSALFTAVHYHVPLLGVGEHLHRSKKPETVVCSVPGVYVDMDGAEASRAVVAGRDSKRLYLVSTTSANKSAVIFLKTFFFHFYTPFYDFVCIYFILCGNIKLEPNRKDDKSMKKTIYKKLISSVVACAFICALFCVSTAAIGYREGVAREGNGPMDNAASDSVMNDNGTVPDSMPHGNVDTGNDGHIGTSSGTGEFADETTPPAETHKNQTDTGKTGNKEGPVESVIDGAANGAANAVDNATDMVSGNSGIWGIIVVVIIIAVIAILFFVFFSKKK